MILMKQMEVMEFLMVRKWLSFSLLQLLNRFFSFRQFLLLPQIVVCVQCLFEAKTFDCSFNFLNIFSFLGELLKLRQDFYSNLVLNSGLLDYLL